MVASTLRKVMGTIGDPLGIWLDCTRVNVVVRIASPRTSHLTTIPHYLEATSCSTLLHPNLPLLIATQISIYSIRTVEMLVSTPEVQVKIAHPSVRAIQTLVGPFPQRPMRHDNLDGYHSLIWVLLKVLFTPSTRPKAHTLK